MISAFERLRSWMGGGEAPSNRRVVGPKARLDRRELRLARAGLPVRRSGARERTHRRALQRAALLARLIDPDRDRNPVLL